MTVSPELVGVAAFGVLLLLMFSGIPVAVCMILVSVVGTAILRGIDPALSSAAARVVDTLGDYTTLAVLPAFLLMGEFADTSGMMRDAYRSLNTWMGNVRGGLAMASILGAAAFSAVSGTSTACAVIMGRIALPRLLEYKYDPALATGALAAGGTLGNLIPPGILLVVYAVMAEISLGKLFIASYLPGALLVIMYVVQVYIQCKINPSAGPGAGSSTWKKKLSDSRYLVITTLAFVTVLGGIWFGVFTPNEAASIGAVIVFLYALIRKTVNGKTLTQACKNTMVTAGMAFAIVVGGNLFAPFASLSNLPQTVAEWLTGLGLSKLGIIVTIMVVYFILGIPMNALTIMLLTLPILLPVLNAYHIDLVWFGVLVIVQCELANLSPPVGMNLFVIAAMAKPHGISMGTVFRGALPFCMTMLVFNVLLIAFPQIALFLVTRMKG